MATTLKVTLDEVTQEQIDKVHWIIDENNGFTEYFQVESEHDSLLEYVVRWQEEIKRWRCTCPSWAQGSGRVARAGLGCKHCLFVMAWKRQHALLLAEVRERDAELKAKARRARDEARIARQFSGSTVLTVSA